MDVILTVAFGKVCDYPTYRAFLNSFQAVHRDGLKLIVFGGRMSRGARAATQAAAELHEVNDRLSDPDCKQRHWHYAEFLGRRREDFDRVLTVDARDTILQCDPFTYPALNSEVRVLLSAETARIHDDPWNLQGQKEFQRGLRKLCQSPFSQWPIVNGGFVAGTCDAMADFQLTRLALDARAGGGTDQSSLTALANWIADWPGYRIVGDDEPWVFHGHWMNHGTQAVVDDQGFAVLRSSGEPYRLFHQWERTAGYERLLKKFG
jgi:hypothetical protein